MRIEGFILSKILDDSINIWIFYGVLDFDTNLFCNVLFDLRFISVDDFSNFFDFIGNVFTFRNMIGVCLCL